MIYNEKINTQSILDCTKGNEISLHNQENMKIMEFLNEYAKAGVIGCVKYIDPAHYEDKESYFFHDDLYENILDRFDCKNGADFVVEDGKLCAAVYGQVYKSTDTHKLSMVEALVSFHFIDEKQKDNIAVFRNCYDFLDETKLKNDFLSIVCKKEDFFIKPEDLIKDLKKGIIIPLHEKIQNARFESSKFPKKQPTYQVYARTDEEKKSFLDSGLCFIRDWRLGWFEVPHSMLDEFKQLFDTQTIQNSVCKIGVTKEEIKAYNTRWPQAYER